MVWTAQNLIADVRAILQDKAQTRYDDAAILAAGQMALTEVRRQRPDYFFDALHSPLPSLAADASVSVPEMIRAPFTAFVAGWVELADSQFEDDSRALGLIRMLNQSLARQQ